MKFTQEKLHAVSSDSSSSTRATAKRIARNTLMLYFRQILIMLVSLYTVRVVLHTLGAVDYGIYNVVAGIVTMFSFFSSAMATASQRFFSFELGRNNTDGLKRIFSVTMLIYVMLVVLVFFLAETLGLWFVIVKLVVPQERMLAAKWIYQFAILSFAITIITTPYLSCIIAHECMDIYAYVSILEASLKLGIVFLLKALPYDKLIVYGILLCAVNATNMAVYRMICRHKFEECRFKFLCDKDLFKQITGFTGWTIFGAFTSVVRMQALTILINQFFSPVVAAARTIALQVNNALNVFSSNFNTGLYAPIVKEYAARNKKGMFSLIFNGCKITFFLMWIFALPLCLRMEYVLTLWLNNLPEYVVIFTQLAIIESLINSISYPISTAARAPGKMGLYEGILGSLQLVIFISSWIWIEFFDGTPFTVFYMGIIINVVMFFVRLIIVNKLVDIPLCEFTVKTCLPIAVVIVVSLVPLYFLNKILPQTFWALCLVVIMSLLLSFFSMYYFGLDKNWRIKIKNIILKKARGAM